ncbi:MAG: hypothetical protein HGB17_14865, partial [Syntrophobacteraceae bacterium]|nr:hypothetical protein [Syntrophobacteraceae bacterium]
MPGWQNSGPAHWQNRKSISGNHRASFACILCFAVRALLI